MWIYQQSSGKLWNNMGELICTGYAGGDAGKRPDAVNNPKLENAKGVGPLPHGRYTFGIPVDHSQLGPYAIPLTPNLGNKMYGRGGFYMHGDNFNLNRSASDGCIIMPHDVRESCYASNDHQLVVIS